MVTVVISQPMFFPWVGMLEQMRLADYFVHYDDVQFPLGRSFTSRVQIKLADGIRWLTVPVQRKGIQRIMDVRVDRSSDWRKTHRRTIRQALHGAPFFDDMMAIAEPVYSLETESLSDITIASMEAAARYYGFSARFLRSSEQRFRTTGTRHLLDIVQALGGTRYVTGQGARNYLDHELFESRGIAVEYMDYQKVEYRQLHGPFTPYVTCLDLIANTGKAGRNTIVSGTQPWREFCANREPLSA